MKISVFDVFLSFKDTNNRYAYIQGPKGVGVIFCEEVVIVYLIERLVYITMKTEVVLKHL